MGPFGVPFLELERGLGTGQNRAIRVKITTFFSAVHPNSRTCTFLHFDP